MNKLSLLFSFALLTLLGCANPEGNNDSNENETESAVSSTTKNLSGSMNTPASTEAPVSVTVLSYSNDDVLVDSKATTLVSSSNTNEAYFSLDIKLATEGGYVVFTSEKEGFTSFSRSIQFETATDVELQGRMQAALTSTTTVADSSFTLRSGMTRNSYTFALMKDRFGRKFIASGGQEVAQARLAADASDLLVIDIPASSVPNDTTSLTAKLANFDPNDAEDAEFFPGEYEDSDGNELVSVAFDFAEIETQSGESLGRAAARANARLFARNTTEPTIISRYIPQESCSALESLGDADAQTEGFQIPVFTYNPNTGLWDRLGEGTVYLDTGAGVGNSTTSIDCINNGYYLEIAVSNEDFLSSWWNLDYPLTFAEPVNLCAAVRLENQEGDLVSGSYVWMSDDDGRSFSDTYGYSDEDGLVTLNTTLIDGSDDRTATVRYWDYVSGDFTEAAVTLAPDCSTVQTITLVRPDTCEVSGSVEDATGPVENIDLYAYGFDTSNVFFHNGFATTDQNGQYSMSVVCNTEYTLFNFSSYLNAAMTFNVDGEVDGDESSDNGDQATLNPMEVTNLAPFGYAYLDYYALDFTSQELEGLLLPVYDLDAAQSVSLWAWAYDLEGDYPLTITVNFKQLDGTVIDTFTATADSEDDIYFNTFENEVTFTSTSAGSYYLSGTVADSKGNSSALYADFAAE